ncbi:MAG: helix-hairpin-helix domain-containing protein [Acidobacteria bacterium]|nr:helix-hairpin-helix domain-containing protein [Acidobacteriota bacterium]
MTTARWLLAFITITLLPSALVQAQPAATVPIVLLRRSAKPAPDKSGADVLVPASPERDPIAARAAGIMAAPAGYGQLVLRLSQRARTYLSRDPALPPSQRAVLTEPAFLFLSDRQGGFPSESFWLEQPGGSLSRKADVPFVDMVVGERDLQPGNVEGLEAIYAHELGHLVMTALAGPPSQRASSAIHFITVKTDAWYAFTEGWGEHFQPMSLDHYSGAAWQSHRGESASAFEQLWYGRFAREQVDGCWICPANLRFLRWHGPAEQRLRDEPVRRNVFAHRLTLPGALLDGSRPAREARMFRDVMPPSPDGELKNGPEMMASEGVIATLFYRLASDERLRNTYRERAFYEPFLLPGQAALGADVEMRGAIAPAENVYLKLFDVFHRQFAWGEWPAIELVRGYAARFPDEAAAVYDVFLDVTRGVTVDKDAVRRHAEPGYLAGLRQRLIAGHARIDGNMGPSLWMVVPGVEFGMGLFRYFAVPTSLTFDLNAADVTDLLSVPGVSPALASAIVRTRDGRGWFATVDDFAQVPGMTADLMEQFRGMRAGMVARMKKTDVRHSDSALMKDYLVFVLKGSYYAAAVWQFGRALVLAGLGVALLWGSWAWWSGRASESQIPARRRRWWRRAVRALGRGIAAASIPCLISAGMYAAGLHPTPRNMLMAGAAWGAVMAVALKILDRHLSDRFAGATRLAAGTIVASLIIGAMY